MGIYYSPSTEGFYTDEVHSVIPSDKIEITEGEHRALLAGGNIAIGASGKPENKPSRWHSLNSAGNAWEITAESQALKDISDGETVRLTDIETEQDASGVKKITVERAFEIVDNASTLADVKQILKKIIVHIIK